MTRVGDCGILHELTSSADANGGMAGVYALVVICEIVVIGALWLLGRIYG